MIIYLDITISEECKLALLDLMCIHNSDDLKPRPFPLEAYYMRGLRKEIDSRGRLILANTWKYAYFIMILAIHYVSNNRLVFIKEKLGS